MALVDRTCQTGPEVSSRCIKTSFYAIKLILYSPKEPSTSMFNEI